LKNILLLKKNKNAKCVYRMLNAKKILLAASTVICFVCIVFSAQPENNAKSGAPNLTSFQKQKLEYYQMELEAKTAVLKKELMVRKKLFSEELEKNNDKVNVYLLEQIADDIKYLSSVIEQLWIDAELSIRNTMSYEQYSEFKSVQYSLQEKNSRNKK